MPEQFIAALMLTYGAGAFGAIWYLERYDRAPISLAVSRLLIPLAAVAVAAGFLFFVLEFGLIGGILGLAITAVAALSFNSHVAAANDSVVTVLGILALVAGAGLGTHVMVGGPLY